jgi:hypothetical protein
METMWLRVVWLGLCLTAVLLGAGRAGAATCSAPTSEYRTIQAALDDGNCTEVVVLGGTHVESLRIRRMVTLRGASAPPPVIEGQVRVEGPFEAVISSLWIDVSTPSAAAGCYREALLIRGGARVTPTRLELKHGDGNAEACLVFADGFEDGSTAAWSNTVP